MQLSKNNLQEKQNQIYDAIVIGGAAGGLSAGISLQHDRVQETADTLTKYDVQIIGANHCTGIAAIAFLWHELAGKCISCSVGTRLNFGI
jgi:metal-dependent hydrolase (beta-lactamase superfamily II)